MSDYTSTFTEIDGNTIDAADFSTEFDNIETASATKANKAVPAATGNIPKLSATGDLEDSAVTLAELQILDGATVTTAELNILDGVTATTAEINVLDGLNGVVEDGNGATTLYAGRVGSSTGSGTVDGGTGWSYSWSGAQCTITHNLGTTNYTPMVTGADSSGARSGYAAPNGTNTIVITTFNTSGAGSTAAEFNFMIAVD